MSMLYSVQIVLIVLGNLVSVFRKENTFCLSFFALEDEEPAATQKRLWYTVLSSRAMTLQSYVRGNV